MTILDRVLVALLSLLDLESVLSLLKYCPDVFWFGSDDEPELHTVGWGDMGNVDMEITDATSMSPNFYKERLVLKTLTSNMNSHSEQSFLNRTCNVTTVDISLVENKILVYYKECDRCKKRKTAIIAGKTDWIMDSGASRHFTHELSDFAEYTLMKNGLYLTTAKKGAPLQIMGEGTVYLTYV